jgi:hypothetical protein
VKAGVLEMVKAYGFTNPVLISEVLMEKKGV